MNTTWLLVGALPVETGPLIAALGHPRPRGLRLVTGTLAGVEVAVLTCGVGPSKARSRTAAVLGELEPQRVMSLGTCGALVDGLETGSLVEASSVRLDGEEAVALEARFGHPAARVVTVASPVWTPEARARYAKLGDEAVEMEAAAVLQAVRSWRAEVPVHALKVVSDQAGGVPDPGLGKPRELRPMVVGRFLARARRLSATVLVPALREGLARSG